jgi:hypothetical protein
MKKVALLAFFALISGIASDVFAQIPGTRIPPRVEDHFWRRKVVNRIDLTEKINEPLTAVEDPAIYQFGAQNYYDGSYGERAGVVVSLINGLKSGKYLAYHPDSLTKALTYDEVVKIANQIQGSGAADDGMDESSDEFDDFDAGGDFEGDDAPEDTEGDDLEGDTDPTTEAAVEGDFKVSDFESVLEFIEDRIFDKNRSDMVYDIQYLRLVWVDPAETIPDKNFICFKYSDIIGTLENTQWKNKYNDAEYRNMREIFELRMFNSIVTNVSGRGVPTLSISEFRRNQLVEFEHHLWCY